jgi:hypothetical protein
MTTNREPLCLPNAPAAFFHSVGSGVYFKHYPISNRSAKVTSKLPCFVYPIDEVFNNLDMNKTGGTETVTNKNASVAWPIRFSTDLFTGANA